MAWQPASTSRIVVGLLLSGSMSAEWLVLARKKARLWPVQMTAGRYGSSYCKIFAKRASPPQGSAHLGGNQAPLDELENSALHTACDQLWLGPAGTGCFAIFIKGV